MLLMFLLIADDAGARSTSSVAPDVPHGRLAHVLSNGTLTLRGMSLREARGDDAMQAWFGERRRLIFRAIVSNDSPLHQSCAFHAMLSDGDGRTFVGSQVGGESLLAPRGVTRISLAFVVAARFSAARLVLARPDASGASAFEVAIRTTDTSAPPGSYE